MKTKIPLVVKRGGHRERFDEKKVYGSVYAACASAHYGELQCEKIADDITKNVRKFLKNKKEVKSAEIRRKIESVLKKKDKELAFFYSQHVPNLRKL